MIGRDHYNTSLFVKGQHYVLTVRSWDGLSVQTDVYCIWEGLDFYPLQAIMIHGSIVVHAYEMIDNRVEIINMRKME